MFYRYFILVTFSVLSALVLGGPDELQAQNMPVGCEGRQPTFSASISCIAPGKFTNCSEYDDVFGFFPGSSNSVEFFQNANTWTAMKIDMTDLDAIEGTWKFEVPQGFVVDGQGSRLMTLSKCPGDFHKEKIEAEMGEHCYERVVGLDNLTWKRSGRSGADCSLVEGETYWLNILYTTDPVGTPPGELTWDCSGRTSGRCGNLMKPVWR